MRRKSVLMCVMLAFSVGLPLLAAGGGGEHHGYNWDHFTKWLVNATVFFGGLAYILKKPVGEFFTSRRNDIQESLSKAEESRKKAAEQLQQIEEQSKNLESEVSEIIAQASADAAREKERLIKLAETEAAKIGEQAKAEIENMRHNALVELKTFLADLAVKEAEKTITGTMTDAERKKLFVDFSARLGAKS